MQNNKIGIDPAESALQVSERRDYDKRIQARLLVGKDEL
jgi:hypothetical protein